MPRKIEQTIFEIMESTARNLRVQPLNLGGIGGGGGGVGGPPGGFIGWLPQTRVAYDETEAATLFTPLSGMSLLDNLNHIRYRLGTLESGGGTALTVQDYDGNLSITNIDTITFSGAILTNLGGGNVLVVVSGGSGGGDDTYLRLDATNDPVTGQLEIIPAGDGEGGIYLETNGDAYPLDVEQYAYGGDAVGSPVLFLYRSPGDSSVTSFVSPMIEAQQDSGNGTMTGKFISLTSDGVERFLVHPAPITSGVYMMLDGDVTISDNGTLVLFKNNGTLKTKIAGDGYMKFGLEAGGQHILANTIGYDILQSDGYFEIIGAGADGSRIVKVYDRLLTDNLDVDNLKFLNDDTMWPYIKADGTVGGPLDSTEHLIVDGTEFLLGVKTDGSSMRMSIQSVLDDVLEYNLIPIDGWLPRAETWTRTGNHTFTVSGNLTTIFRKGARVKYNDGAVEYGVVASSSHSSGTTTVNLIPNNDYAMAATFINDRYVSYIENPSGWPSSFSYTFTPTSSAGSFTSVVGTMQWQTFGSTIKMDITVIVTTVGTASGFLFFYTPVTSAATCIGVGRENAVTGYELQWIIGNASTQGFIQTYHPQQAIATGYTHLGTLIMPF